MDRPLPPPGGEADRQALLRHLHQQALWTHFAIILLGAWQLSAPAILGYHDPGNFGTGVLRVTAERGLPPAEWRAWAIAWSDVASGALLIAFGALSLSYRQRWAQWITALVGLWLLLAPLVFWAPDVASYTNDTLVGAFAIAFAILLPTTPGVGTEALAAPQDIPPGWDYSPSSWSQRLPIIALAFVGFFIARYLAAYQLGHIDTVWDPLFGDGTARVVTSRVSRAWPVADAGVGAVSYLLEALTGMIGDRRRWRTIPWLVLLFGVLVVPLGGVSIFFIIIQPIAIGTWCALCLVSAAATVAMLPYSFDEILATCQFLRRVRREGGSVWHALWHGGVIAYMGQDRSPPLAVDREAIAAMARQRQAVPKALLLSAALGVWLMCTRLTLGTAGVLADSDHVVGALVFTVSIAAFAEVARPLRAINILLGMWLFAAPWVLEGSNALAGVASMVVGGLLIALALPRGAIRHPYGGWDRYLVW